MTEKEDKKDVDYIISCQTCGMKYIGETSQQFKNRKYQRQRDVENKNKNNGKVKWQDNLLDWTCDLLINDHEIGHMSETLKSHQDTVYFSIKNEDFAKIKGARGKVICHIIAGSNKLESSKSVCLK